MEVCQRRLCQKTDSRGSAHDQLCRPQPTRFYSGCPASTLRASRALFRYRASLLRTVIAPSVGRLRTRPNPDTSDWQSSRSRLLKHRHPHANRSDATSAWNVTPIIGRLLSQDASLWKDSSFFLLPVVSNKYLKMTEVKEVTVSPNQNSDRSWPASGSWQSRKIFHNLRRYNFCPCRHLQRLQALPNWPFVVT